ncbi:MAG: hypothetical protein NVV74_22340 [Magnetospirillum sp.]|nr:hypothetical protein [Magnetospirillum sp.]
MSRNSPPQTVVALAEARATRTLAATQALLLPEADEPLAAEELSRRVAAQLAALPAEERPLLRRKVLVAVHDLEGLVDALQAQLDGLADELRKVSTHSSAATAYGRMARRPSDHRS